MSQVIVVLGVDDAFGGGLCDRFEEGGWKVFGLTYGSVAASSSIPVDLSSIASMQAAASTVSASVDHVDVLVANVHSAVDTSRVGHFDFEAMRHAHDLNALASLRFVEAFLPLTTRGLKRICFVTGPEATVGDRQPSEEGIGVRMSRATVHMAATVISNDLRRDGYSIRLYVPDKSADGPAKAFDYLTMDIDDGRPQIFDQSGKEWGF